MSDYNKREEVVGKNTKFVSLVLQEKLGIKHGY